MYVTFENEPYSKTEVDVDFGITFEAEVFTLSWETVGPLAQVLCILADGEVLAYFHDERWHTTAKACPDDDRAFEMVKFHDR